MFTHDCFSLSPPQWQIVPLLSKTINHFKSHRSERMIALLKVLLAEEYYHVRQYDNAIT